MIEGLEFRVWGFWAEKELGVMDSKHFRPFTGACVIQLEEPI